MVFGAVYVGQLPMKSMMCCLRRLRGPPQSFEEDNRQRLGGGRRSSGSTVSQDVIDPRFLGFSI